MNAGWSRLVCLAGVNGRTPLVQLTDGDVNDCLVYVLFVCCVLCAVSCASVVRSVVDDNSCCVLFCLSCLVLDYRECQSRVSHVVCVRLIYYIQQGASHTLIRRICKSIVYIITTK